jgi:hypothetical protein
MVAHRALTGVLCEGLRADVHQAIDDDDDSQHTQTSLDPAEIAETLASDAVFVVPLSLPGAALWRLRETNQAPAAAAATVATPAQTAPRPAED